MLENKVKKIAERIMRMHAGFITEESTPIVKKIEGAFRNIIEMFKELEQELNVTENKTAGISLHDQKSILGRLLLRSTGIHNEAMLLHDLGEDIVRLKKSNQRIKDIFVKIRDILSDMMSRLHKIETYAHTPVEHRDVKTHQNNFGLLKRKYDILIGKM